MEARRWDWLLSLHVQRVDQLSSHTEKGQKLPNEGPGDYEG